MNSTSLFGLYIAHRGLHNNEVVENSMLAFKRAVAKNISLELDIHETKDGQIIVFHDYDLKRMFNSNKTIKGSNYEDLNSFKYNDNTSIPLLKEVLAEVNSKVLVIIELKEVEDYKSLVNKTFDVLKDYQGEILLQSFCIKTIAYLKKKTNYQIGLLLPNDYEKKFLFNKLYIFNILKPDYIGSSIKKLPNKLTIEARKRNIPVFVWTIKNKEELEKVKDYSDSFILDGEELL